MTQTIKKEERDTVQKSSDKSINNALSDECNFNFDEIVSIQIPCNVHYCILDIFFIRNRFLKNMNLKM